MGDFRIIYGSAIGPFNNFFARTDGLFGQADTTPDVTNGTLFYTQNTSNTTITYFDLSAPQGVGNVGWAEGKEITVIFLDDSTRLARSNRLVLTGSNGALGVNGLIKLIFHNSSWYEEYRSYNNSQIISATSGSALSTTGIINVGGNVNLVQCIAEAGTNTTIRRAINGEQGQVLTLIGAAGSDTLIIVNSAAADTFVSTSSQNTATQFRLASSAAISFVRYLGRWHEIRPVSGNSSGQLQ